jgi:hypothetical protein
MKRICCLSTSLLYITLFAACVGSVPLLAKNRVSIRSVVIDQQVSLPEDMFYRGPEFALEAFGVVGYVAGYNINMKSEEKLAVLMRKEQIDVSQIVRDEFITEVEARQVFPSLILNGGDATITLTIKTYGLAYGLSSELRPILGVEGCMTRSGGPVIWKKYAYVTNMSDQTPSYTIAELVTDPERIRQVFQLSAQIIAADLVRHMQGF